MTEKSIQEDVQYSLEVALDVIPRENEIVHLPWKIGADEGTAPLRVCRVEHTLLCRALSRNSVLPTNKMNPHSHIIVQLNCQSDDAKQQFIEKVMSNQNEYSLGKWQRQSHKPT